MNIPPLVLSNDGLTEKMVIRHFQKEDAPAIANLFRTVYGEAYPAKIYYDPPQLIQANQEQSVISFVACNRTDDVIGHTAFYRSAHSTKLYEMGAGLILPAYRTQNVFTPLLQYAADYLRLAASHTDLPGEQQEITAVFGEMVCNHVKTQKSFPAVGAKETALGVDVMPAEAYFQEQSASGRVSTLIGYIIFQSNPHMVYLPRLYQPAIEFIYGEIAEKRNFIWDNTIQMPAQADIQGIKLHVYPSAQLARIAITQAGANFGARLQACEEEARQQCQALQKNVQVIQSWIALDQPETGWIVSCLRERGYFFGGILPYWFGCDAMLMQKLIAPPQWEKIEILSERAKKLSEFVRKDWKAVASLH